MFLKGLKKSKKGISAVIATIIITSIMVFSIAMTYFYIIPTIDRGELNSTISISSLFFTKMDGAIQSLFHDGIDAKRTMEIDADAGTFDFSSGPGVVVRTRIDGSTQDIFNIGFGSVKLSIISEIVVMPRDTTEYVKGSSYFPIAVTEDSSADPAMITLTRPQSDLYLLTLYYRLITIDKDDGVNGDLEVSVIVYQLSSPEPKVDLHRGSYKLVVQKTGVAIDTRTYSGSDFQIEANKGAGYRIIFSSLGLRTNVTFHMQIVSITLGLISLE